MNAAPEAKLEPRSGGPALRRAGIFANPLVLGVILLVFALNLVFIVLDRRTFSYDDSWYAETSIRFLDTWAREGLPGACTFFIEKTFMGIKAPLIVLLPQPLLLVLGRHDFVFLLANALCLIVASVYLASLARAYAGQTVAAVAVLVFSLMPLTACLTRRFFVEILLTTIVLMFVYHAVKSEQFTRVGHALAAGLAFGLGMLAKVTFPVFIAGVLALVLFETARRHKAVSGLALVILLACLGPALTVAGTLLGYPWAPGAGLAVSAVFLLFLWGRPPRWRFNLGGAVSLALWSALPWYLHNAKTIFTYFYSAAVGEISMDYGAQELFSLDAIRNFWIHNTNVGFGVAYVLGLAVALFLVLATSFVRGTLAQRRGTTTAALWLIGAWIIPAAIAFTLGRNRTTRFLLPLLPGAALLHAVLLQTLLNRVRVLGYAVASLHGVAAVAVFAVFTFGGPTISIGPGERFVLCGPELAGGSIVRTSPFPLDQILAGARQVAPRLETRDALAMFLTDTVRVNQNTMCYTAAKAGVPLVFGLVPYGGSREEGFAALARADLLVYQEGGGEYSGFPNRWGREVLQEIKSGKLGGWCLLEQPAISLPDGGVVRFAERAPTATDAQAALTPCLVLYRDGALALVGYALEFQGETLQIVTCWMKVRPVGGRYAVAAHLINADRSFERNIDHGPAEGPGKFARLGVGESVTVSKTEPVSDWAAHAEFLALALYDLDRKRAVPADVRHGFQPQDGYWVNVPLPTAGPPGGAGLGEIGQAPSAAWSPTRACPSGVATEAAHD